MTLLSRLLSREECQALIGAASALGFSRPAQFDKDTRDCERVHTVDTLLSRQMMARLRGHLPEVVTVDGVRWRLDRFTHHWRYVEYGAGGHFRPHYDGAKMLPWS